MIFSGGKNGRKLQSWTVRADRLSRHNSYVRVHAAYYNIMRRRVLITVGRPGHDCFDGIRRRRRARCSARKREIIYRQSSRRRTAERENNDNVDDRCERDGRRACDKALLLLLRRAANGYLTHSHMMYIYVFTSFFVDNRIKISNMYLCPI